MAKTKGGAVPYRKGADFERRVKKDLEDDGCFVIRSPKSGSEIDLLCIIHMPATQELPEQTHIWFIQCKMRKYMPVAERKSLYELAKRHGGDAILAYEQDGMIVYTHIGKEGEV